MVEESEILEESEMPEQQIRRVVGNFIHRIRDEEGMTQQEFINAFSLNIDVQRLGKIERGELDFNSVLDRLKYKINDVLELEKGAQQDGGTPLRKRPNRPGLMFGVQ